ncbi:histone-lysine N-methyltransferase SETMAR [Trichonephila clavata]|uniref:Histone-lysine N-methyltransferase SETMAR n=1 Tax=Trichonephila clavata TaxID=2740835 RepID=A0A8X6G5L3_TRICU|nr:histone-lysine N-methyltransferase SETMAR [Trichonephila clavata]
MCQVEKKEHDTCFFFTFNQGYNTAKPTQDICSAYGESAIAERTTRGWYAKFKNENLSLKHAPHSGCPVEFDEERLDQLCVT